AGRSGTRDLRLLSRDHDSACDYEGPDVSGARDGLLLSGIRRFEMDHELRGALFRLCRGQRGEADGAVLPDWRWLGDEQFVDSAGPTRAVYAGRRRSVVGNYVRRC